MALMKVGNEKFETTDFENIPLELWKTTTFRAYCEHLNLLKFGMKSITRNIQGENAQMSRDIKQYGREAVKKFIEICIAEWTGNQNFPTASYSQLRVIKLEQTMPRAVKLVQDLSKAEEDSINVEDLGGLF